MDVLQFRQKFIEEAEDLLVQLDNDLIVLEKDPADASKIDQVFRVMHTLKGSSGMFGYEKITEVTHELESLYDRIREGTMELSQVLLDLTFTVADHIRNLLGDYDFVVKQNIDNQTVILQNIDFFLKNKGLEIATHYVRKKSDSISNIATWHILFNPDESIIKRCINLSITFHDLFLLGQYKIHPPNAEHGSVYWNIFLITDKSHDDIEDALIFVMDYCKIQKVGEFNIFNEDDLNRRDEELQVFPETEDIPQSEIALVSGTKRIRTEGEQGTVSNTRRIYVEAAKLDNLMYLVSELVTAKSELLLSMGISDRLKIQESAEKIDKLSKLFSDNALSIRLVSLQEMLGRFRRLIRDLAKVLGKQVEFEVHGEETELDKNIIDVIAEPILHLIRNCIDHGIEMPETRQEKGKNEQGKIKFSAYKSGNYVFIQISDDGNGIDPNYILKKAIEKGFIDEGINLTSKEILDLIFLPGFSTAGNVSEVSGRGVGMDIVMRRIREIRGEISIDSVVGRGTSFNIKLQQTISIIETLLVTSYGTKYAIPMEDVEICGMEFHSEILDRQSNLLEFNSELIPFVSLRTHLSGVFEAPEREKLIIINKQDKRYAIVADQIIGEFQAVVKPLGRTFNDLQYLSGASIYGDGSIVLLLDTDKLKDELCVLN